MEQRRSSTKVHRSNGDDGKVYSDGWEEDSWATPRCASRPTIEEREAAMKIGRTPVDIQLIALNLSALC